MPVETHDVRLLIVDDEPDMVEILTYEFSGKVREMLRAGSGDAAIALPGVADVDVAFIDLSMPGMDGLELLRRLKTLNPRMVVVILTGYGSFDSAKAALQSGAYDFLSKPAHLDDVSRCLERCLDKVRLERDLYGLLELLLPQYADIDAAEIERMGPADRHGTLMRFLSVMHLRLVNQSRPRSGESPELTRMRRHLENEELFLDSILNNLPDMVFVKDAAELRFVRLNRAGERLLGRSSHDFLGRNDYDFFPKDQADFFVAKDRQTLMEGKVVEIPEEPISTPAGVRYLHTKKIPIMDTAGEPLYLLGISEDVTVKKAQAETIAVQQAALNQAGRLNALGEMAGGLAHELNNPLAAIKALAEQMAIQIAPGNQDRDRLASIAERTIRSVNRMAAVIAGLRNFARDGSRDPFERVELERLLAEALDLCRSRIEAHRIDLTVEVPAGLAVRAQRASLSQAVIALLTNAYEALSGAQQDVKTIRIVARAEGGTAELRVEDNGPGVHESARSRLMQPFFTTKPVGRGPGLGLSIAKGICEAAGGTLGFEPGAPGATFIIRLPVAGAGGV